MVPLELLRGGELRVTSRLTWGHCSLSPTGEDRGDLGSLHLG